MNHQLQTRTAGGGEPVRSWPQIEPRVDAWRDAVSALDPAAQRAIFHDNAARLYRLPRG